MLANKINAKISQFIICLLYLNPLLDIDNFLDNFNIIFENIADRFPQLPIFVEGDFNAQMGERDDDCESIYNQSSLLTRKSLDKSVNSRGIVIFVSRMQNR